MEEEREKGRNKKIRKVHRKTVEWMIEKVMVFRDVNGTQEKEIKRKERQRPRRRREGV